MCLWRMRYWKTPTIRFWPFFVLIHRFLVPIRVFVILSHLWVLYQELGNEPRFTDSDSVREEGGVTRKNKKGDRDSFHRVASGNVGVARWAWVICVILTKLTGLALHKTGCTLMPPTRPWPPSTPFTASYYCLKLAPPSF